MLKKLLARFGKGAASVDLQLDHHEFLPGDNIHGEIVIQGGEVEQKMNHLAVQFIMDVRLKQGTTQSKITTIPVFSKDIIRPGEMKVVPFDYRIPANIPISSASVSYFFDTNLDIESGVDRKDVDRIIMRASKPVQSVFDGLSTLSFREKPNSGSIDAYGQEFAFFPTGQFSGQINKIELRIANEDNGIRIWMEVDCKNSFKEIEARREFKIHNDILEDKEKVSKLLKSTIKEIIADPHFFSQPFSYSTHSHEGRVSKISSALPGMVGGLAIGLLGGTLVSEMMDDFEIDEMFDDTAADFGNLFSDVGDF